MHRNDGNDGSGSVGRRVKWPRSDERLTAETREGRFYFWNYCFPPFSPSVRSRNNTRKYVTFGCLCLFCIWGDEYYVYTIYICNTLRSRTAPVIETRLSDRFIGPTTFLTRRVPRKTIWNVFCLFFLTAVMVVLSNLWLYSIVRSLP